MLQEHETIVNAKGRKEQIMVIDCFLSLAYNDLLNVFHFEPNTCSLDHMLIIINYQTFSGGNLDLVKFVIDLQPNKICASFTGLIYILMFNYENHIG